MNSKFLLSNAQSQLVKTGSDESKSGLKSWHWALLLGVPSVTIVGYLLYKRYLAQQELNKKAKTGDKKTKSVKSGAESESNKPAASAKKEEERPKTELEKAIEKKNQGNKFFQAGSFEEAIKCYSEAIDLCPKSDKDELPKFYQNRAAAYENLVISE